jgi:hypothetical protein
MNKGEEIQMCVFMVRSKVKTERVSEVEAAIDGTFSAIAELQPERVLPLDPRDPDVVRVKSRDGQERDLLRRKALT